MDHLQLDRLFNPKTIAMIGASSVPGKWGFMVLLNILKGGYAGTVYPVNPKGESILGLPCYRSIGEIPGTVDLAIITVPASSVSSLIDDCGKKEIPNVIVITSDFSETGHGGAILERHIVEKARGYGMRIVGPNTMGVFSAGPRLNALMPPVEPLHGPVSMFSQSGNVGTQMLSWGAEEGVGFEKYVSSGNEGDLTCEDYLRYFGQDSASRVILAYLEGVDPGSRLLPVAREISPRKPVIVFKGGRTRAGAHAAASHSGAIAGALGIYQAVFRQAGMIEVSSTQGLVDCAKAFSLCPVPRSNRVAVLTRGGGWGVITADALEENGLLLPPLPGDLVEKLDRILPRYWSRGNPIDMVAVVTAEPFMACLEILAQWEGVDAVLALGGRTGKLAMGSFRSQEVLSRLGIEETALARMEATFSEGQRKVNALLRQLMEQIGKPIISVTMGSNDGEPTESEERRTITYPTPERAVRALAALWQYRRIKDDVATTGQ